MVDYGVFFEKCDSITYSTGCTKWVESGHESFALNLSVMWGAQFGPTRGKIGIPDAFGSVNATPFLLWQIGYNISILLLYVEALFLP